METDIQHNELVSLRLKMAGLRPTRQRILLANLLFSKGDRHVTAEILHAEVISAGKQVSLATIYNALRQFTDAGLLRELAVEGAKTYFDTNITNHSHFFLEDKGELIDITGNSLSVSGLPDPPEGTEISHVDVVIRLVSKKVPLKLKGL
ncbi:MAG: iron response transcriptional regulator IrrA [Hyphomicrobium sp.]